MTETILSVNGLSKSFRAVKAVRDVSFTIPRGKTFGLVGESGSGKSTTARLVLRLVEPTAGTISFRGRNLAELAPRVLRAERRHMQMIFQDPFGSLNPRMSVRETLVEPQLVHGIGTPNEQLRTAERLLAEVSLPRAALDRGHLDCHPAGALPGDRHGRRVAVLLGACRPGRCDPDLRGRQAVDVEARACERQARDRRIARAPRAPGPPGDDLTGRHP